MSAELTNRVNEFLPLITQYATRLIGVILLFLAALMVAGWIRRGLLRAFTRAKLDETLSKFFANFARYTVLTIAVIACLGVFGVQTTSFAAVLAAAGFAVGMAFQGTLSNFSSGIMLLVFRPFKVGQFIKAGGETGTVDEISLFTTTLDTPDNRRIIVPNSAIFGSTIENVSFHPTRRVDVAVGTDYSANLGATRDVLVAAAKEVTDVLKDPAPVAVLTALGGSSIDWSVRAWCASENYWAVREELTEAIKNALDKANVGIPFPQLDVHLGSGSASLENLSKDSETLRAH